MDRDRLRPFRSDRVTDRQTLLNICIHCSDLSAQVLPWITASRWEERISQEFAAQAQKEIDNGMSPSPMMMNLDDMKVRGKGQMGKLGLEKTKKKYNNLLEVFIDFNLIIHFSF